MPIELKDIYEAIDHAYNDGRAGMTEPSDAAVECVERIAAMLGGENQAAAEQQPLSELSDARILDIAFRLDEALSGKRGVDLIKFYTQFARNVIVANDECRQKGGG